MAGLQTSRLREISTSTKDNGNKRNSLISLREKCRNTEFFLVRIFLYSVQIQEIRSRNNSVFGHFSRSLCNNHRGDFSNKTLQVLRAFTC